MITGCMHKGCSVQSHPWRLFAVCLMRAQQLRRQEATYAMHRGQSSKSRWLPGVGTKVVQVYEAAGVSGASSAGQAVTLREHQELGFRDAAITTAISSSRVL